MVVRGSEHTLFPLVVEPLVNESIVARSLGHSVIMFFRLASISQKLASSRTSPGSLKEYPTTAMPSMLES